jgi:hypothetical protein
MPKRESAHVKRKYWFNLAGFFVILTVAFAGAAIFEQSNGWLIAGAVAAFCAGASACLAFHQVTKVERITGKVEPKKWADKVGYNTFDGTVVWVCGGKANIIEGESPESVRRRLIRDYGMDPDSIVMAIVN